MRGFLCLYQALLLGGWAGILFGFLRPLRPRWLGELLFLAGLFRGWCFLGFDLWGGDLRLACTGAYLLGLALWILTFGRWLAPVFSGFWKGFSRLGRAFFLPFKKIARPAILLTLLSKEKSLTLSRVFLPIF